MIDDMKSEYKWPADWRTLGRNFQRVFRMSMVDIYDAQMSWIMQKFTIKIDAMEGVKNLSDPNASEADKTSIEQAKAIVDLSGKVIDIYKIQVDALKTLNAMDNVGSLKNMATSLGVTDEDAVKMIEEG